MWRDVDCVGCDGCSVDLVASTPITVAVGIAYALLIGYLAYAYWAERTQPVGASALHEKARH